MALFKKNFSFFGVVLLFFATPAFVFASELPEPGGHSSEAAFLFLAILLISAKIGSVIEKIKQPAVLGELAAGIFLSMLGYFGVAMIEEIRGNEVMAFFAELGAVILLFQIGLETHIQKMVKVGVRALFVAIIGVILPFALGTFVLSPILFPDSDLIARLFVGAALVATSVGITGYVFQEMKMTKTRPAQTVLGAAVIDDVLGLLVLAIVSALASGGNVDPMFIVDLSLKAFGFLAGAIVLGRLLAGPLSRLFTIISKESGMKLAFSLTFALTYAYFATLVGLAPIVGAFAAGLILEAVHFRRFNFPKIVHSLMNIRGFKKEDKERINNLIERYKTGDIEDIIHNIGLLLIPIFFVYTGLQVDFASLLNPSLYFFAIIISIFAILGKVLAGVAASGNFNEKILVGVSMVPRGEVGLIFASVGKSLGAISNDLFSVIILVIIITTFISPPVIKVLLNKYQTEN